MTVFVSREILESTYTSMERSPRDMGKLELIVARPAVDRRTLLDEAELDTEVGLVGDSWLDRAKRNAEGNVVFDSQIALMNSRIALLLAPDRTRWPLAGDQLYVDFDISKENLPAGQRLRLGTAELEISELPHTGCKKFMARFGVDALAFISTREGKSQRMRGVYARVIQSGRIDIGNMLVKVLA